MAGFECLRCGECCRSYYIVSLPQEVKKQAALLGLSEKDFVQAKMQLYLQLFPAAPSKDKMNIKAKGLPKKIMSRIVTSLGFTPENFIALPMLCFKRARKGECVFYSGEKGCSIYSARPDECRLFPFISMDRNADFRKIYGFCRGLQEMSGSPVWDYKSAQAHFRETAKYLGEVRKKGFKAMWASWPSKGVCLLEGKLLCKINEKEFFGAIGEYA